MTLEAAEAALAFLQEACNSSGVLVEGQKDVAALEALGIGGVHIILNEGVGIVTRADRLVARGQEEGWRQIVVLMDWDRTGMRLQRRLEVTLAGQCVVHSEARKRLMGAFASQCIEELPAELAAMRAETRTGSPST